MKIEIDQSGRIEETNRDTILAYSNSKSVSVRITAKTKRRMQELFRRIGEPRTFIINIFTSAIYLLIEKEIRRISEIVIDLEYPGYEKVITKLLLKMFKEKKIKNPPEIYFALIGKNSKSHKIALKTFRKKIKANQIISYELLIKENFENKNGYPALKYPSQKAR